MATRKVQRKTRKSSSQAEKKMTSSQSSPKEERKELSAEIRLKEQYGVIRDDIEKLKDDLKVGYFLAKDVVESNSIWEGIFGNK